ncbi:hypothetical protein AALP_AAs62908U000100 [Arabis alpina]|uniref:Uncharacterized protein n=1 Tax=Arabis alpina TaxID=50452 RepID=A0A087G063_ARAAL|nr:hypothetical protein AALP_AAs62908U000100 [Arabis alpina]
MEKGEGSNQHLHESNTPNDQDMVLTPSPNAMVAPFPSFPPSNNVSAAASDAGPSNRRRTRRGRRSRASDSPKKVVKNIYQNSIMSIPNFQGGISQGDRDTGNGELVNSLMMRFDAVRRRLRQNGTGNADNTAIGTFKYLRLRTNATKRIGPVPGVDIGDIFYFRGEMHLVGLHVATVGIEFMEILDNGQAKSLAISVVSSGENVDVERNPAAIEFTGYGGTEKYGDGPSDQTIDGMNLALDNAINKRTIVRVVRSEDDPMRKNNKIYIYDGLYYVTLYLEDKRENGFKYYKFKLVRIPGQKPGFEVWKDIEEWRSGLVARPRMIVADISNGAELSKIPLVNEVGNKNDLAPFEYVTTLLHTMETFQLMTSKCICKRNQCRKRDGNCHCVLRNGGECPYVDKVLVARKPMVYECGSFCCCSDGCENRMIQNGMKHKLEVFKTEECGWGLRSWDPLRAGTFICEYAGEVIKKGEEEYDDEYIFDSSRVYSSLEWNYEHQLVGEETPNQASEESLLAEPLVISAKRRGNAARFMNHSCAPNVLWQPMKHEKNGKLHIHIGLFAMKHIPPMTELRFDYGTSMGESNLGKKMCWCGSDLCRGSFGGLF